MKKIVGMVTTFIMILGVTVLGTSAPAHAGYFNDVTHAKDDSGYTAPIQIECSDGRRKWLYVGQSSPGKCGFHVKRIIVGYNQTVYCKNYLPPYENRYYYTGNYNGVPSGASYKCYMQRPL